MSRRARAPKYEMKYYSRSSAAKIEQSIVSQRDHTVQVLLLLDPHHRVTTVLEFLSSIKFFCCTILDTTIENNGKVHSRLYGVYTIAFLIAADSISFRERGTPNCISTVDQHHDGAAS